MATYEQKSQSYYQRATDNTYFSIVLAMEVRFRVIIVLTLFGLIQGMSKEKAMFLEHSESCLEESKADPKLVAKMFSGDLTDDPALKRHVLCMLIKCKIITKDGKIQKAPLIVANHKYVNVTAIVKVIESCDEPKGETPEEIAWNFYKCGYDKKETIFSSAENPANMSHHEAHVTVTEGTTNTLLTVMTESVTMSNTRDSSTEHKNHTVHIGDTSQVGTARPVEIDLKKN